jgi:integrase
LHKATEAAEIREPRPAWHDLRHTLTSLAIAQGADVVFLARTLGHRDPSVTLRVYADLFDRHAHADRFRDLLDGPLAALTPG